LGLGGNKRDRICIIEHVQRGFCRLCGKTDRLTKDHVPNQAAGNKGTYWKILDNGKKEQFQGGVTYNSLCKDCNNITGGWYGGAYTDFYRQIANNLDLIKEGGNTPICIKDISPLRVIKQIVTMFISVSDEHWCNSHIELRKFVAEKKSIYKKQNNFQIGLLWSGKSGHSVSGRDDTFTIDGSKITQRAYTCINHPPMCFILEHEHPHIPFVGIGADISFFIEADYEDARTVEISSCIIEHDENSQKKIDELYGKKAHKLFENNAK